MSSRGLSRRRFLGLGSVLAAGLWRGTAHSVGDPKDRVTLFLCGDVMLGRGIDQLMPTSADPRLFEPYLRDARQYIRLAEAVNGPIERPVGPAYPWGEALGELASIAPDVRLVNLENAVTTRGTPWPDKGIHYRMHPDNLAVLQAAGIDACSLANNHVLDWGHDGLRDTLSSLNAAGIAAAGVGLDTRAATTPAIVSTRRGGRVRLLGLASASSGVPAVWRATARNPGVNMLDDSIDVTVAGVRRAIGARLPGDLVVVSIHWGGNWGWEIPAWQRRLAHALIDTGLVDIVHGHSSHHAKGIEVYRDRLVLYGCGDLINDYEGIRGHGRYRSDLRLMYFPTLDAGSGRLLDLRMVPLRSTRLSLRRAGREDSGWLLDSLNREGARLGTGFALDNDGRLVLDSRSA